MDKDFLSRLTPKARTGLAVALLLIFLGLVMLDRCSSDSSATRRDAVYQTVPDPDNPSGDEGKIGSYSAFSREASADRYWQELEEESRDEQTGAFLPSGSSSSPSSVNASQTHPSGRTRTRSYDVEDLFGACPDEPAKSAAPAYESPARTEAQPEAPAPDPQLPTPVPDHQSDAPVSSRSAFGADDGFSSFPQERSGAVLSDPAKAYRCMFLRSEKVKSGQRVTVRLLEDLPLGGVTIPANTHLQGVCTVSDRIEVSFRSLDVGGRIVSFSFDAYDTDGGRGIYCSDLSRTRQEVLDQGLSIAGSELGSRLRSAAQQAANLTLSIMRNKAGEVTVSIPSGYAFYIMQTN